MTVVRIDEEDLDEEDRAILAEVARKGYYHGRPKSQACPPPARIVASDSSPTASSPASGTGAGGRAQFDEFQRKWDRFDREDYLEELEAKLAGAANSQARSADRPQRGVLPSAGVAQCRHRRPADAEFKLLLAGDGGVGKTALLKRHLTGEFATRHMPTQQPEVQQLRFTTNCGEVAFNVWDLGCAGQRWHEGCIRESSYNQGQCAVIMFDVTSRASYRSVPSWYREISKACGPIPIVLVANKVDVQERSVKLTQVLFHQKKPVQFYELSVRDNSNSDKPFLWLARRLANQPRLSFVGAVAERPQETPSVWPSAENDRRRLDEALRLPVG